MVPFSVSQITTSGWPFERDVEAFAAAGAPGIGVSVRKLALYGVEQAARRLQDAGLRVSCLTSAGPLALLDGVTSTAALAGVRQQLTAARVLGADCLMLLPGAAPSLSWEEAAARAAPLLRELGREAEGLGVRLALEPVSQLRMDLGFLHTFDEALDFVDALGSPAVGVVLELNNAWIERRLYENIRRRTDRIALVQVSDFKVGTLRASERVVIGDGDIPLRRICHALADAGYAGWYDIELLGTAIEVEGYERVVPRAVERFRALWNETEGGHRE